MSHGRISRASRRHPDARRRAARYGNTHYGQRATTLPPHMLPGATGRTKKTGLITIPRLLVLGGGLVLVSSLVFLVITIITGVLGAFGTVEAYKEVNKDLPNAAQVSAKTFQTTRIYDRNGTLLQEVDNPYFGWRSYVPYDKISPYLINATVASEDSTFWTNEGVEPLAIVRGAVINFSGAGSSGGSTITQQLVRAIYPNQISALDVSLTRKAREAMAAVALAKQYSKTDIMTMYLNQIYYGARSYGIESASQTYFNKNASDLTLAEASLLAGLPQAPSYYEPSDPDKFEIAKRRQQYVLNQMVKYRYITRDEATAAFNEPLHPKNERTGQIANAPHFTEYVKNYIIENYGEEALYSGLQVTTTIDLPLQAQAEQIVAGGVADMEQYQRNNGAMVVMVPWSGEVLAMVGSADFSNALINGQVNYATSLIQPGSSIKPIVYTAAFEKGWNPATVMMDVPTTWKVEGQPDYQPNNYTGQSYGAVPIRIALANSLNIPAVKATDFVGVQGAMDTARKMGIVDSLKKDAGYYGLSFGLGAAEVELIEHTNAYATLANNGTYVPANPIKEIKDSQGNVLFKLDETQVKKESKQAVPAGNAFQTTSILTDNDARAMIFTKDNLFGYTQTDLGRPTAAKSGTTEDWKDLWTMGYTTDVAIGVWVGRSGDSGQTQMPEIDGIQAAGPIWRNMMIAIHNTPEYQKLLLGPNGQPVPKDFPVPSTVSQVDLCATTGHLPTNGKTTKDWVVQGQVPTQNCNQITPYEKTQLDAALKQAQSGNVRWANNGLNTVYDYARMAGETSVPSSSSTSGDNQTNTNSDNSNTSDQVIVPANTQGDNTVPQEPTVPAAVDPTVPSIDPPVEPTAVPPQ
ncbi:MAG: transglycosylase domain-containing protein [Thermomicrobiales bacterium]